MDIDFESYIRGNEPDKKEKASAWQTAIGLQAVDGLQTSDYLKDTAIKHIEGDISIDEVKKLINGYYQSKTARTPKDEGTEEADSNTRITAVFAIKYLRSIGFDVNNDLFANNSWYFRNALVRANYRNVRKGVESDMSFLVSFFRNLMMGELTEQVPNKLTEQVSEQVSAIIEAIGTDQHALKALMEKMELKHRPTFITNYLTPAIQNGFVTLLYPDNPKHPRQKYLLTVKGLAVLSTKSLTTSSAKSNVNS